MTKKASGQVDEIGSVIALTAEETAAVERIAEKQELTPHQVVRHAIAQYEMKCFPHWEYGKASCGIGDSVQPVPVCSKCGTACAFDTAKHERECWGIGG